MIFMAQLNCSFSDLNSPYIFPIIEQKLAELKKTVPLNTMINLSIGDISLPLAPTIIKAITQATCEMGTLEGVKGYPPTYGYSFLRSAIAEQDYCSVTISPEEIYVSDGINSDAVNILELFAPHSVIGILNPTYPAYLNSSILGGRKQICLIPCLEEHRFIPQPPKEHCDVVYLCTPSNPTGVAMTKKELQAWVEYAQREKAILCIDAAYSAFASSADVPKSIYEIPGAHTCAIEFKSFSKSAGFTGLRCAYTVIPKTLTAQLGEQTYPLHKLWEKRQDIKFNGVAYPIQRGAEAALKNEGLKETYKQVEFYRLLADRLKTGLLKLGHQCWGGLDSPYIWWKVPSGFTSWQFFDHLLTHCHLISLPGIGFGSFGEGYVRLCAFSSEDKIALALERIEKKV